MAHLTYPITRKEPQIDDYHGTLVADPYRWLEDLNSAETQQWITAQNTLTIDFLEKISIRDKIKNRFASLWNYSKSHAPFKRGGRYFQYRNSGLQNQDVLYVMNEVEQPGSVLLDPNTLSPDETIALTAVKVSWNGEWLAYATSTSGSDWRTWHVRNISSGQDIADTITWSKFSNAAWLPDNDGFFYARYAEPEEGTTYAGANYNQQVFLHLLGTPQSEDLLCYERSDHPKWGYDPMVTDDGQYLILHVSEGTDHRNRVFYRKIKGRNFTELLPDLEASYEFIYNEGSTFYFLTDLEAERRKVISIDVNQPAKHKWRTVIAESQDVLQHVVVAYGEFITLQLHNAYHQLKRYNLDGKIICDIELPSLGAVTEMYGQYKDDSLFYSFSSFTTPLCIFQYDLVAQKNTLLFTPPINFDFSVYETKTCFVTSKDGTQVPMFLVHHHKMKNNGVNPTLLYGYGGFNIPITPAFSIDRLIWLEMGGVFALANLRGGGEFGKKWHEGGSVHNKQNVFDDFIACAESLIDQNITSTSRLVIEGRSNGGLLVGACLVQRPDLFGAALPTVGVLDMLRFQKFTIGWAWTSDYGNPDVPEEFATLYEYSPLHNIRRTSYPPTLVLTGDHDDRVMPAHSYKFASAMQAAQQGESPILIRIQTKAGHGIGKPTEVLIQERADILAFLIKALNLSYSS